MPYTYQYPRMLVTVDAIVLKKNSALNITEILLIRRKNDPFKGKYALPGGFPELNELLVDAAKRELFEETGLKDIELTQLKVFDKIDRDPRDRNISVTFIGITTNDNCLINAGDDAEFADWFPLNNLPSLAFDHDEIIEFAKKQSGL